MFVATVLCFVDLCSVFVLKGFEGVDLTGIGGIGMHRWLLVSSIPCLKNEVCSSTADISCRFRLDVTLHGSCFGEDYAELGCLGEDPVVIQHAKGICNISWLTGVMTRVAMTKRGTFLNELLLCPCFRLSSDVFGMFALVSKAPSKSSLAVQPGFPSPGNRLRRLGVRYTLLWPF